jgi:hypothetical protein
MSRTLLTIGAAAAIFLVGAMVPAPASSAPLSLQKIQADPSLVQPVQARYCFYVDGWNGPGFYLCGRHRTRGQGWHGHRDSQYHSSGESRGHGARDSRRHSTRESQFHSDRDSRRHSTWESMRGRWWR